MKGSGRGYAKGKEEEGRKTRGRREEGFQTRHEGRLSELVDVLLVGGRYDKQREESLPVPLVGRLGTVLLELPKSVTPTMVWRSIRMN